MKHTFFIIAFMSIYVCGFSQNFAPLFTGSSIMIDTDALKTNKDYLQLQNGTRIKTSDWNGFLKNLVSRFPASEADSILDGLMQCSYEWDKVEKMIRFDVNRQANASSAGLSFIAFSGFIKDNKIHPFVKFSYSGNDWIYANRIKLVCDEETFEYDSLKFYTLGTQDYVTEYTLMPATDNMLQLMSKIINSHETIIRFYGDPLFSDLEVTDKTKREMKKVLKTIKALQ